MPGFATVIATIVWEWGQRLFIERHARISGELPIVLEVDNVAAAIRISVEARHVIALNWQQVGAAVDVHEAVLKCRFRLIVGEIAWDVQRLLLDAQNAAAFFVDPIFQ